VHLPPERIVESESSTRGEASQASIQEAKQWLRASTLQSSPPPQKASEAGRLLVADDNADMREYLQRLLAPHWQTQVVRNGREALTAALEAPPDLVLSDVMMPEMDGVELLNALRADERTRTVPVILVSARAGEEARLAGLETGADDYLVKPFSAREVLTRVKTHLEMGKVRLAAAEAARALAETREALLDRLSREHSNLQAAHDELKRTQAQLVQSAKMASLGELVAGIAHEINNPLAFVLSHLATVGKSLEQVAQKLAPETLQATGPAWERALARAHEARVGVERIQALIHQLRTFSRLDEGELKRVSVRESIDSVLTILSHRTGDRLRVVVTTDAADSLVCFASLFNQAVMNLVSNAIDAIEGPGTITIATRKDDAWFELTVGDTGRGIPEELRDRVFEPFFTTKPVGQGTGLGLSMTYSIAQKHGGTVELSPSPSGGTLASLRLPLDPKIQARSS
jgi:two-component system, NtrC family, sensor kinase